MKKNRKWWFLQKGIPGNLFRLMKLTLLLCCFGILHVSAMSYAQTGSVNIHVKDVLVSEIFKMIEHQSNYTFVYNNEQIKQLSPISLNVANAKITHVLDKCL